MFSMFEIDHVVWFLLLMGGWVAVNALIDLSSDRAAFGDTKEKTDERTETRE